MITPNRADVCWRIGRREFKPATTSRGTIDEKAVFGIDVDRCVSFCRRIGAAQSSNVDSCAGVKWTSDIQVKYPGIAKSCVGVVERSGVRYVKLSGTVTKMGKDSVTVGLDHTTTDIHWKPGAYAMVLIEGKDVAAMSVAVDQKFRFFYA